MDFFFVSPNTYDQKMMKKSFKDDTAKLLNELTTILSQQENFSSNSLENIVKSWIESKELGFGKVMTPLRLALVGEGKGPHLFDILEILGKEESLARITNLLNHTNDK